MKIEKFDRKSSLVIIPVTVKVDGNIRDFKFAVDTGASITLVNEDAIKMMGYTKADNIGISRTITASKSETVYEYNLNNFMSLGLIRRNFRVISRVLPLGLGIDGLLGLDFFKHKELTIDFRKSEIRIN